ncbi:MAG: M16 family metallopeptidase [Bacteroidia bacterium]
MTALLNRTEPPLSLPLDEAHFGQPECVELHNGIKIWHLNSGSQEVVRLEFVFHAGAINHTNPLAATICSSLLQEGTSKRNSAQISEAIDRYGAFLELDVDKDFAFVTLYTLKRYYKQTLPIVLELIQDSVFPQKEYTQLLQQYEQKFKVNIQKVSFLASRGFQKAIFQDSPYGNITESESFASISLEHIKEFARQHFRIERCHIMLSGYIDSEVLDCTLKSLSEVEVKANFFNPETSSGSQAAPSAKYWIEKEDALQSAIRIGRRMFTRSHPDFFGMKVLCTVLGGYFGSRLMSNIREDKGYTYGIGAGLMAYRSDGWFYISTEVGTDVTQNALKEIYIEMARLRNEPITEEELNLVKNYLNGQLLKSFDGPFEQMDRFKTIAFMGGSNSYYEDYRRTINQITPEELNALANRWLQEKDLIELVAGKK